MTDKIKIVIILAVIVALAIFSTIQSCQKSKLERKVSEYEQKNAELSESLDVANQENAHLRDMMTRANKALEKMIKRAEEAKANDNKRNEKIDDADPDWLQCPLPDELREAFGAYCYSYAGSHASSIPVRIV